MLHFTTGARAYRVHNPAVGSVVLVNPARRARNRHKVDVISAAVRSGLLSREGAKRIGRKANREQAANVRRSQEDQTMGTRRKRASRRRNPLKRKRNAGKRVTAPRRKKVARKKVARKNPRKTVRRKKHSRTSVKRHAPRRKKNRSSARRRSRAASKRRNFGMSMATPIRTRGYVGFRRRRRNPTSGAGGFTGSIKSAIKSLPDVLKVGLNVGAGIVVTGLINGVVDRFAGATLGRATGLTSALASAIAITLASRIGVARKIPLVNSSQMLGGVGLYAVIQLARLFLPESWRAAIGMSGYDRHLPPISGFGDYVREPWAGPAEQAVGEYVRSGSDAAEALSALHDAMTPSDPFVRANQLASAAEAVGELGEYVRTGAEVGSAMGEFDATSSWLARGRYATSAHPSPPDQRLKQYEYGRIFAGLGLAPTVAQEAAVAVMEKEAAGMTPQQAIDTTADEYGCTSCATSVPCGVLPISASSPSGIAVPEVDGHIVAGGLFANPFQNIS